MNARHRNATGEIDWKKVHERLDRARRASEDSLQLSAERAREVMEERARLLARVPPRVPDASEVLELVTFRLGNEKYGLETQHIKEVVRFTDFTPVPGAPDFLVGLINLRGDILAVFDLRRFCNVDLRPATEATRVLVLGGEQAEFGILADAVEEVVTVRTEHVHEPPGSVTGVGRDYLRGVTNEALLIFDGASLLQSARLFVDQGEE
jgi:purine-binding chemotaxis protein CheW